jgi:hypothetical protein
MRANETDRPMDARAYGEAGARRDHRPRGPRRPTTALLALVVVLVAGVGIALPTSAQEVLTPAAVALTATPDTMLVQGDDVTVNGTGAEPNAFLVIGQCLAGATAIDDCLQLSGVGTSGSGNFATIVTPRRLMTISGVVHDCADVGACELAAFDYDDGPPAILASAAIQFDPSVPPPPPPSLAATPSTGLVQGDVVTLVGVDYPSSASVGVVQCLSSAPTSGGTGEGCDLSTLLFVQTDGSGGFTQSFTPRRLIFTSDGAHDCALEACVIGAGTPVDGEGARADIQFDPNVPPPPPPTITITPSNGLADGQTVTVTGVGFQPGWVNVVQCGQPPEDSGSNCELSDLQSTTVAGDGTFSYQMAVNRVISTPNGDIDCTGTDVCAIGVGTSPGRGDDSPIGFAADPPTGGAGGGNVLAATAVSADPTYAG